MVLSCSLLLLLRCSNTLTCAMRRWCNGGGKRIVIVIDEAQGPFRVWISVTLLSFSSSLLVSFFLFSEEILAL